MNPYAFVRLPERVDRKSPAMHHNFTGISGVLRCRLSAITPIFLPKRQLTTGTLQFMEYERGLPYIPGSSLKGVIRSVAEAVSESCIGLSGELFERGDVSHKYQRSLNRIFATCFQAGNLCPACRLFGMVSNKSQFLGKVSFSDAPADKFERGEPTTLKPLMEPKPRHTSFYQPNGEIAGRKFYFHHDSIKTTMQRTDFTKTVVPLLGLNEQGESQSVFEFAVNYTNLTPKEYNLLVFSLVLTQDMRHKIGGGKPLGLGTVKIEIIEARQVERAARYQQFGAINQVLTTADLQDHLEEIIVPLEEEPTPSQKDLMDIWCFPPPTDDYIYPDQKWFSMNSQTSIWDTP
jgi:CRISPR/Cas system CSM-associated protein Csm3 (group 7 of RAMP superfamily)